MPQPDPLLLLAAEQLLDKMESENALDAGRVSALRGQLAARRATCLEAGGDAPNAGETTRFLVQVAQEAGVTLEGAGLSTIDVSDPPMAQRVTPVRIPPTAAATIGAIQPRVPAPPDEDAEELALRQAGIGWYAALLSRRNLAVLLAVGVLIILGGAGALASYFWNHAGDETRYLMFCGMSVIAFGAGVLTDRRFGLRATSWAMYAMTGALLCLNGVISNYLELSATVSLGSLAVFALMVAVLVGGLAGGRRIGLTLSVAGLIGAQMMLANWPAGQAIWLLYIGAAILAIAAWWPWVVVPYREDRPREVGLAVAVAGGAFFFLAVHVLVRSGPEPTLAAWGRLGPVTLLLAGALIALAWSIGAGPFSVWWESVGVFARAVAIVLSVAGGIIALWDAPALIATSALMTVVGPAAWRRRITRPAAGLIASVGFVLLITSIQFAATFRRANGYLEWLLSEPLASAVVGGLGMALVIVGILAARAEGAVALLHSPTYCMGATFAMMAAIRIASFPEWNHWVGIALAGTLISLSFVRQVVPVAYLGLLVGGLTIGVEGADRSAPYEIANMAGAAGATGGFGTTLALLVAAATLRRRRPGKGHWINPAVHVAIFSAVVGLLFVGDHWADYRASVPVLVMAGTTFALVGLLKDWLAVTVTGSITWVTGAVVAWKTALPVWWGRTEASDLYYWRPGFGGLATALALAIVAQAVLLRWRRSDRGFGWALGLYLGAWSGAAWAVIDALDFEPTIATSFVAWQLLWCGALALAGLGLIPAGLALSGAAALLTSGIAVAAWHYEWPEPFGRTFVMHLGVMLAVGWTTVAVLLQQWRKRKPMATATFDTAVEVFYFFAVFTGLFAVAVIVWEVLGVMWHRTIWPFAPDQALSWIGLLDLLGLAAACSAAIWSSRNRNLVTPLLGLMILVAGWISLMIPAVRSVEHPVTRITFGVPSSWLIVLMLGLTVMTGVFVFAQGAVWRWHRKRAWPDRLDLLHATYPDWPGFRLTVGGLAMVILAIGLWELPSFWTIPSCFGMGACLFLLAHRHWNRDLAEVAMATITLGVVGIALQFVGPVLANGYGYAREFGVRYPVMCNAGLFALAIMAWFWPWLSRVWDQQLLDGRAWTTAGRLIPVADRAGFLVSAAAVVVAMSMAIWPLTPYTPVLDNSTLRWIAGIFGNLLLLQVLFASTLRSRLPANAYMTFLQMMVTASFVAIRLPMNPFKQWVLEHWPVLISGLATVSVMMTSLLSRTRLKPFEEPLFRVATRFLTLVALTGVMFFPRLAADEVVRTATLALIGSTFGFCALQRLGVRYAVVGAGFLNAAIASLWVGQGFSIGQYPYFYAVPVGLTLIGLAYGYRSRLSGEVVEVVRSVGLCLIFIPLVWRLFQEREQIFAMLSVAILLLCIASVAAGMLLKTRSFLYSGVVFLVIELTAWAVHFYDSKQWITWSLVILIGVGVVSAIGWFESRRNRI